MRLFEGGGFHFLASMSPIPKPPTAGLAYGPFPIWLYTALVAITRDLPVLVLLRALLFVSSTALAIAWLARLCRSLRPMLGAAALLSPYLWIYSRQFWDNTLLIPLGS